jgi:hypothetical protein
MSLARELLQLFSALSTAEPPAPMFSNSGACHLNVPPLGELELNELNS